MRYFVKIYRYRGDYSALVPDLPGCTAAADTVEEARRLIARAIGLHLELMRKHGESIPKPGKHHELDADDVAAEALGTWVEAERRRPRVAPRKRSTTISGKR